MKIKISETTQNQLDYLVAKCNGIPLALAPFTGAKNFVLVGQNGKPTSSTYEPSKSWAQGGPIIERAGIEVGPAPGVRPVGKSWLSEFPCNPESKAYRAHGPTPLIAAMRCYVAAKLGDECDIPDELK